jgi:pilus assembly protein CpaC
MKQMGLSFLNNENFSVGIFQSGQVSGSASANSSSEDGGGFDVSKALESAMDIASPYASAFQVALHALEDDTLAVLSLLKSQGLTRILASPTLVTMSGQEADFLVGGEYPYPVQRHDGYISIEFKRFGVMLRFTPVVVGKETLNIRVEPEVSSLDSSLSVSSGGVAVPGLRTRRGATTLQLKDGQTFAMAGLLSEETRTVVSKIPFLGDLPFLGTLFSSKEFQKNESELVIIVTPRLVRAMNPKEVPPLPGENAKDHMSDVDFFLTNWVEDTDKHFFPGLKPDPDRLSGFIGETGFSR